MVESSNVQTLAKNILNQDYFSNKDVESKNTRKDYDLIKRQQSSIYNEKFTPKLKFYKIIPSEVKLVFDLKLNSVVAKVISPEGDVIQIIPSKNIRGLHANIENKKGFFFNKSM